MSIGLGTFRSGSQTCAVVHWMDGQVPCCIRTPLTSRKVRRPFASSKTARCRPATQCHVVSMAWTFSVSSSGIGPICRHPTSQLTYSSDGSQKTSCSSYWYSLHSILAYQLTILNLSLCRYAVGMVILKPRWVSSILYVSPVSPTGFTKKRPDLKWVPVSPGYGVLNSRVRLTFQAQSSTEMETPYLSSSGCIVPVSWHRI